MNREEIIQIVQSLSLEDRRAIYGKIYSLDNLSSDDLNEKLVLISLVSLTYQKMREKEPTITVMKILTSITGQIKDNSAYYQFLESLAILVDDFSYGSKKIDACGMKTSAEIINRIKEILNTWMPF